MAENEADSAAIDIEGLVYSIEDRMSQDRIMSPNCCIFRIPTMPRELNDKAYVPYAFSIGPFHHGRPAFEDTEKIKIKYLQGLISRSPSKETILRELINSVKHVEREARECYAGPIGCSPDEFVKILVIDGCFIIELLRKLADSMLIEGDDSIFSMADSMLIEGDDPIFSMACMPQFICHDLILLENQVPWVVLELLFNKTLDPTHNYVNKPLIEMVKSFIVKFLIKVKLPSGDPPIQDIKHIADVGRKLLVSSIAEEKAHLGSGWILLPSATSLVEAGVKIKRGESTDIMDLKYDNGVLEIPPLTIDETTETLVRNIISFEQCYPHCEPRFTCYAMLLDNLINTAKDVDILSENKIIKNWLNPEDAIPFFNKLYYNAFVKKMYYQSLCKEVNEYCNRRWPRWRAVLVRNYFNTPWAILSTAAAVILLILTSVQTWYAVFKK